MSDTTRQYRNPPIQEAVCDFTFELSHPFKVTHVGQFENAIKSRFDGESEEHKLFEGLVAAPSVVQLDPAKARFGRMLFPNKSHTALCTLRPGGLSVNSLRPYMGWGSYRELIEWTFQQYTSQFNPKAIKRIGLRYINQIVLPVGTIALDEYFVLSGRVFPFAEEDGNATLDSFLVRSAVVFESTTPPTLVNITFASASEDTHTPPGRPFVLDIDTAKTWKNTLLEIDKVMPAVDEIRSLERRIFELCITDKSRAIFDAQST